MLTSNAKVKIIIVNPEILKDEFLRRDFMKSKMSQREYNIFVSNMIDGSKILNDPRFVETGFIEIIKKLEREALNSKSKTSTLQYSQLLKHSKTLLLSDHHMNTQRYDQTNMTLVVDLLAFEVNDKFFDMDYSYDKAVLQHLKSGYPEIYELIEEYRRIMDEMGFSKQKNLPKMIFSQTSTIDNEKIVRIGRLRELIITNIELIMNKVKNGFPLLGQCDLCQQMYKS